MRLIFNKLLMTTAAVLALFACSCGEDELTSVEAQMYLTDYVWETDPENDYFISDTDVERDRDTYYYYFLDDGVGIARQHHYNFDYVGGSHSSKDDGWAFTYSVVGNSVTVNEGYGDYTYTMSKSGDMLEAGTNYYRREYRSDDYEFLSDWAYLIDDDLNGSGSSSGSGSGSSSNFGFKYSFTVDNASVYEYGSKKKWMISAKVSSDMLYSRKVNWLTSYVECYPGKVTNSKEYGTVNSYPDGGACSFLINTHDITTDSSCSWRFFIYLETSLTENSVKLYVTPKWTCSVQGELEGETITCTITPTTSER